MIKVTTLHIKANIEETSHLTIEKSMKTEIPMSTAIATMAIRLSAV